MKFRKSILFIVCLLFLTAIGFSGWNIMNKASSKVYIMETSTDFPVSDNLQNMINESDYIITGKYKAFDSKWNMARNPSDINHEDPNLYVEGHRYIFEVEDVLKGSIDEKKILINHKYSRRMIYEDSNATTNDEGIIVKKATKSKIYTFDNIDFLYIEPEFEQRYILFLKRDENFKVYYASTEPFSIKFDSSDIGILQSNLIGDLNNKTLNHNISLEENVVLNLSTQVPCITDNISGNNFTDIIYEINNYLETNK